MEAFCKKKYRLASDLCYTFGFSEKFFRSDFNYECIYGLSLHVRRCQTIVGAQFFRAKFFLDKLDFYMDDEIADALASDEDGKAVISSMFSQMYREVIRSQIKNPRG